MLGSRYVPGGGVRDWGLLRRLISRGGGLYAAHDPAASTSTTSPAASSASAARCSRRSTSTSVRAEGYVFQIEVTYRALLAGFRVREVPIVFRDRTAGSSKMSVGSRSRRCCSCRGCAERGRGGRRSARAGARPLARSSQPQIRRDPNVITIVAQTAAARRSGHPLRDERPRAARRDASEPAPSSSRAIGHRGPLQAASPRAARAARRSPGCCSPGCSIALAAAQHRHRCCRSPCARCRPGSPARSAPPG